MKLLARFNLLLRRIRRGAGRCGVAGRPLYPQDEEEHVREQAKLMMDTTNATRAYTTTQIKPPLEKQQRREATFLPQTVPAYSAIEVFNYLHARNPGYSYKEATLNPTNLRDRATDWENDVIGVFRNNPALTYLYRERDTPTGKFLFLAHPLRVVDPACLECHSTPGRAPAVMLREYGRDNGFGWKLNDVIGAQIVSVPESLPLQMARSRLKTFTIYLAGLALATILILDAVLVVTVIKPVAALSRAADEMSQGKSDIQDLPVKGRNEISVLATSFNRMQRSLSRALKLLENESESRGPR